LQERKLVYVVDDDPSMLKGVQRLLREHGYDTISFASANSFHEHDDFGKAVCVVLDIDLAGGSGIELHQRLKSAGVRLPVIYMTGKDSPATRNAAIASGCLAYLTKPFAASSLIEPIERASNGRV
jgi:FixJ family two-component response regulator